MKSRLTFFLFLAVITFATYSCKNEIIDQAATNGLNEPQKVLANMAAVQPPFQNIDVPFHEYEVDVSEGDVIKMSTGTVIRVPKDAFIDENGNPVEGKVTINYREFHNAADIIASGIPMANRGDDDKYMETAGMFEIKGKANGKSVNIAPEKNIEVSMASFVKGNNYDFFYLDEKECQWITKGNAAPSVNQEKKTALSAIAELPPKPAKPEIHNKSKFVFDLDINYSNFPELKSFKDVIWQYDGSSPEEDPEKNPWVFNTGWTSIELLPSKSSDLQYELSLRSAEKSFRTKVCPVLSENNYEDALSDFEKKNEKYQTAKKAMETERQRLEQEADLLREFRVNDFGIYNWDVWKNPARILVNAQFEFDTDFDADINAVSIFLVTGSNRSVVRYTPKTYNRFSFDPKQENRLIAVLPGNKVAVFEAEDFRKLNTSVLREQKSAGKSSVFRMKTVDESISSVDDLKSILDKLG